MLVDKWPNDKFNQYFSWKDKFLNNSSSMNFLSLKLAAVNLLHHYKKHDGIFIEKLNEKKFLMELTYLKSCGFGKKSDYFRIKKDLERGFDSEH